MIKRRKRDGFRTEYQLLSGEWITVKDIFKTKETKVSKITVSARLTMYYKRGCEHSQFKTLETIYETPKTKTVVRKKRNEGYDIDLFDELNSLMRLM